VNDTTTNTTNTTGTLDAVERTVELDHPIDRVWQAISQPDELARWFPNESATLDVRPGGTGELVWIIEGKEIRAEIHVHEVAAPRRFVWSWGHEPSNTTEPVTTVEFELTARPDGGTTLLVRESGFLDERHRAGNTEGWAEETAELVAYLDAAG
jgi:uncharacterized protein YndB with AHSA1/START domain